MKKSIHHLTTGALIAAFYAALTYVSSFFNLAYGPIQFRLSEALTILPVFTPAAIPGLTIGCILGNLNSPYGLLDICLGTAATLLAAFCAHWLRHTHIKGLPVAAAFMPVLFNAVIVGAEIALTTEGGTWLVFLYSFLTVGLGELVVCMGLGLPLYIIVRKYQHKLFPHT